MGLQSSLLPTLVAQATVTTATITVTATSSSSPHTRNLEAATIGLGAVLGVVIMASLADFFLSKRRDGPEYSKVEQFSKSSYGPDGGSSTPELESIL
jgi:hypothetical protein